MKRIILLLYCIIALLRTAAQPSLGILDNSIGVVPNTVAFNDSVTITFNVINTGDSIFNGAIKIEYSVNDSTPGILDSVNTLLQLGPGATQQVVIFDHVISPPKYAVGDNIVVIWPVALDSNVNTTDSGTTHIFVDTLLGSGPPILTEQIKVFYQNSGHTLSIDYGSALSLIKEVTCYSILGEQIRKYNYPVTEIPFAEISPQINLLVIRTNEGEVISFKILRL